MANKISDITPEYIEENYRLMRLGCSLLSTMQELYKNLLDFDRRRQFTLFMVQKILEDTLEHQ